MTTTRIQAVVFDLDDTLFAERDYVRSGYRAVAAVMAQNAIDAERISEWMWQRFCQGNTDRMFNAAAEQFGLPTGHETVGAWVKCYRHHTPDIAPLPEALKILAALRGRMKLGLLSDGFLPAQQLKFDALGLADAFDVVLFTESLGREFWKPSPVGFERIAAQLGVPHSVCAYVGDNAAKDFLAPNALGWLTIQWRRDGQVHADKPAPEGGVPRLIMSSAAELLSAL
jgi:putative hydrolase of the HAD superfamily